jgi:hypothetical protein|tara:strand:- start:729 stop:1637 length:909 start_codon:yes stop_codon:yes gene_type:complete
MEEVPWPDSVQSLTSVPFALSNFDVLGVFKYSHCSLAVLFPEQFVLQMVLPVGIGFTMIAAYYVSNCLGIRTKKALHMRGNQAFKIMMMILLLIYPGLCTKVFMMFRCKKIMGVEGLILVPDMSVNCLDSSFGGYRIAAFFFLVTYIFGIPAMVFILLKKNRAYLYDEKHPKYNELHHALGGLYDQYEPKYYWFEVVLIFYKMFMTGALCVIGAGTAVQPLLASLAQLFFMLLVLKLAPFENDHDDARYVPLFFSLFSSFCFCIHVHILNKYNLNVKHIININIINYPFSLFSIVHLQALLH